MSPANVMDLSGGIMGSAASLVTSPQYPGPVVSPCYRGSQLLTAGTNQESQQTLDLSLTRPNPGSLRYAHIAQL